MRSRDWQTLTLAGLATFALACGGGDQAASGGDQMDAGGQDAEPAAQSETMQEPVNLPEGVTMEMVTQGRQLFTGQGGCIACHGPEAKGTQLAPDLTDTTWINVSGRNYDEIVQLIHTGVPQPAEHPGPMPPMGGANLTDAQVNALAAYVVSLGS
jgi:mono/diheme cytochrome c family protein